MHDYKNILLKEKKEVKTSHWHWHGVLLFLICAGLALLLVETEKSEASDSKPPAIAEKDTSASVPESDTEIFELSLPKQDRPETTASEYPAPVENTALALPALPQPTLDIAEEPDPNEPQWQTHIVKPGYNFAIICSRAGVKASEVHALMQLGKPVASLKRLYPNDKIRLKVLPDGNLAGLEYDMHQTKRLVVTRVGEQANGVSEFKAQTIERSIEVHTAHASGVIKDSLFRAAQSAGLTDKIAIELASIFAWDIDFSLEVRRGDRFTVVYEQHYLDGEKIRDGAISAAEFVNQGTVYRAIKYTGPDGKTDYYTPDGSSLRKTFMRNPVDFSRISSHFNPNRRHPILNKIRAHKGVDYAARTGTPIKAVGDGKVSWRKTKGGYGKTIILQHGQRYSTLYAHMSAYAKSTQVGRKVKQGQVIGYVGKSGLATGPHLHFEFRIDGVHRNPLTVKHPSVDPIKPQYKQDFLAKIQPQLAQLDTINRMELAYSDQANTL